MKYFVKTKLSENISETPEGFLVCLGVPIARTGSMDYAPSEIPLEAGPNGIVVVDRDEDEVFRPETIASFEGKPLTIGHPSEFVSPSNWKDLAKGTIQNIRRGTGESKDDLIADVLVTDAMAIGLVKNGLREVSCGYETDYLQTGPGRGKQTRIIGNHLALVEQGRAGSGYAINDHKGKGLKMSLKDKITAIFAKAQDEALKVADAEPEMKEKKEEKADDAMGAGYDELVKMVKDLGEKIAGMAKPKDASSAPAANESAEIVAKDEPVAAASIEDRLKALEAAVAKMLSMQSDELPDDVTDEDAEESEESEDADMEEEGSMVGDSAASDLASRVEILSPGMKIAKGDKEIKAKAIKAAYATVDGKKVIDAFTLGKAPDFTQTANIDLLFIGASELLKQERSASLAKTKTRDFNSALDKPATSGLSAEQMNELNTKHYAR